MARRNYMGYGANFDDDDELEPLFRQDNNSKEPEVKPWDVFQDPPRKAESGSTVDNTVIETSVKILKVVTVVMVFSVVLASAVISKGTLLFMTSQIQKNITRPHCNDIYDHRAQYITTPVVEERVSWIWVILFSYLIPELGTFIRSVRICSFKSWKYPSKWDFLSLFITETFPAIGSAIFIFVILPEIDVVKGAMLTNAFCFVPCLVAMISRNPKENEITTIILDFLSLIAQISCFVAWPLIEQHGVLWFVPISAVCISFGWWENYVSESSTIGFISMLGKIKSEFKTDTYFIYSFVSLWKCFVFAVSALIIFWIREEDVNFLFTNFNTIFSPHKLTVSEVTPIIFNSTNVYDAIKTGSIIVTTTNALTPLWVFMINISTTYICYAFSKFACKVMIQQMGLAFPINLTVPTLVSTLIAVSGAYNKDECAFHNIIPDYLFFNTPPMYLLSDFLSQQHAWIWLAWLLSQAWITVHTWTPHVKKLASTEMLFLKPMYDAFLIDQSIAMNRRRQTMASPSAKDDTLDDYSNQITHLYACGTMWHETKEEMMEFLKSIFRMDEDNSAYKLARRYTSKVPNDYEFETHVLFDDAFVRISQDDQDPKLNDYVNDLICCMDDAASEVHNVRLKVKPPKIYSTPYGGRLEWLLPGRTKLIAHLKDKGKIRAKKRWSQVMYMYYLLGHKIMEREDLEPEEKEQLSTNTYLLALDGDIDFQAEAVHLLVDYMKKNKTLGAACGRIHPIGAGAMAWYQMFEYAIGHWLQKATEHVIGCVLCSPGCFSLFRGRALMENSVMRKYTTVSTEPLHYVQYDQGEDRWLCTLLLQQGFRVEYSAASDAYTHCPEGFNEFYNQRRRWMPSTMANILDLLGDYKHTVRMNDNISMMYIGYQLIMMIGTVIGPGSIFLMLVGAFVAAFKLDQWSSFFWNLVPILIFVIVCATCKSDIQLFFAGVISAVYGLVMMAVLVGMLLQISDDGWLAPSSLFIFSLAGEFIITALLHPKEFNCLKYGIIYYVTVPSMYMLLVIYSIFNMNNVSWGTREVTVVPKPSDANQEKKSEKEQPKPGSKDKVLSFLGANPTDDTGALTLSCAGLFKCFLCTHKKSSKANEQLIEIQNALTQLSTKLDYIERRQFNPDSILVEMRKTTITKPPRTTKLLEGSRASAVVSMGEINEEMVEDDDDGNNSQTNSDDLPENSWFYGDNLVRGEVCQLENKEELFWKGLLDKYLHPIDDADKKEKIAKELKDLRDKMVFSFFMLNSLFVLVIFLLTLEKETLHVNWPIDPKVNFTYYLEKNEIKLYKNYLQLEPIGMVFLIFFALLIIVQFIAMLIHRFGTYSQIISNTHFNLFSSSELKNVSIDQMEEQNLVENIKKLQKIKYLYDDQDPTPQSSGRRKTVSNLANKIKNKNKSEARVLYLEDAFNSNLENQGRGNSTKEKLVRRETIKYLNRRASEMKSN